MENYVKTHPWLPGVFFIVAWIIFWSMTNVGYHGPVVLMNETKYVGTGTWYNYSTPVKMYSRLEIEVQVEEGGPIDVLCLDNSMYLEYQSYVWGERTTIRTLESHYNTTSLDCFVMIDWPGEFCLVLNNAVRLPGGAIPVSNARVHVKLTYETGFNPPSHTD